MQRPPPRARLTSLALTSLALATAALVATTRAHAQEDIADIESERHALPLRGRDVPAHEYFLISPDEDAETPEAGHPVLIVLPGGDGSDEFHAFVKRMRKHALGGEWVVLQPIAVDWPGKERVVWPTERTRGRGRVAATEDFVEHVITHASERVRLDRERVYLLTWSSSGPAAYAMALRRKTSITGFYIAMSVYKPAQLPSRARAKDRAFVIDHSPDDRVCPFRMAEAARDELREAGAEVEFREYDGGHGWRGDIWGRLRGGVEWLDDHHAAADDSLWKKRGDGRDEDDEDDEDDA